MSTLLIDAGNSRIKWAYLRHGRIGKQFAIANRQPRGKLRAAGTGLDDRQWRALTQRWRSAALRANDPLRDVLVVSVAGARFDARLKRFCQQQLKLPLRFAGSSRAAGGVRNGYRDPWRLGADRWVALIGARALLPGRALCVVDAGTALTIDLLDAAGRHRGGAIVPGPQLMVDSLLRGTSGIRRRAAQGKGGGASLFARDTHGALQAGAGHAAAAVIERALGEARVMLQARPQLLLTGGAAPQLRGLLGAKGRAVPDLVLRGLAVLAAP